MTFAPRTASTTIGVAGGSGTLQITSSILNGITAGNIVVGSTSDSGAMTVSANTWSDSVSLYDGSGGITIGGAQAMGSNSFLADTVSANLILGSGGTIASNASGNAIVVATGGTFINNSGSGAPFVTPNGRFVGYSHRLTGDINPVAYQQQLLGYTYTTLPPTNIDAAHGYSATANTWVYAVIPDVPRPSITPATTPASPSLATGASPSTGSASSASTPSTSLSSSGSVTDSSAVSTGSSATTSSSSSNASSSTGTSTSSSSSASGSGASSGSAGSSSTATSSSSSSNSSSSSSSSTSTSSAAPSAPAPAPVAPAADNAAPAVTDEEPPILRPGNTGEVVTPPVTPASGEQPIAAPSGFRYLDNQLNKMAIAEPDEAAAGVHKPASPIARTTRKIIRHIVAPGVATVGVASVGYVLLLGRTMYSALAMLMGLGLGGNRLDPATLLEYWEREGSRREADDQEKKMEGMFG